jgi:Zn-dependent protease with chaperone function
MYYDTFVTTAKFGWNKQTKCQFLVNVLVTILIEIIRNALMTLVCLLVFHYLADSMHLAIFILVILLAVVIVVLADICLISKIRSDYCRVGKFEKLTDTDDQKKIALAQAINDQWKEIQGQNAKVLDAYVSESTSGHSNCHVDGTKVVISETMFDHLKDQNHLMAIIRHEMAHDIYSHVEKMVAMRVVYYCLLFVAFAFLVEYKKSWLPMFGIEYNSLFLCMFVLMHFIHFKFAYYFYTILENFVQRKFEFFADHFAVQHQSQDNNEFFNAMLIVYFNNASDYYTDPLYSLVKNSHPTLNERADAVKAIRHTSPLAQEKTDTTIQ